MAAVPAVAAPVIAPRLMPSRGHATTSKLENDPNGVVDLNRFFQDIEYLFKDCAINDDQQKKQHAIRYLNHPVSGLWSALPSYAAASTYEEWKTAIRKLYPGTSED
ncbi:hypothetical protein H0H81_004788 [Sphagnurus paluster]|uniref:Uncharacterized protein n=1 Tax=Sphagnurus paluster TaxID=117069 RepID=A0A9P7GG19_9AGAR|nr:hypothetical protein H0H81_004788 [Sphagnurus paluster]